MELINKSLENSFSYIEYRELVSNLLEKNEIASKVSKILSQITRGVVNVESLYIKL